MIQSIIWRKLWITVMHLYHTSSASDRWIIYQPTHCCHCTCFFLLGNFIPNRLFKHSSIYKNMCRGFCNHSHIYFFLSYCFLYSQVADTVKQIIKKAERWDFPTLGEVVNSIKSHHLQKNPTSTSLRWHIEALTTSKLTFNLHSLSWGIV